MNVANARPIPLAGSPRPRRSPWLGLAALLTYLFLYVPLVVVVLYSFSATRVNAWPIRGYTFDWYGELLKDDDIWQAIRLSLFIGIIAATLAVILGTLTAYALDRYRLRATPLIRFGIGLPIVLPGIVTGVAMLSYFSLLGVQLSRWTIIIAHTTFCLTLILNNVAARLSQLPRSLEEASADLGANRLQTFRLVTFPLIRPAVVAGAILAFTLSFDEVVVTFFLTGRDKTLPLLIWGRLRRGISPEINATATVIILASLALVLLANRILRRSGQSLF